MSKFVSVPISQKKAKAFIDDFHRHHTASVRDIFRVAARLSDEDEIIGVAQVGRPVSCYLDDGYTLEITRLCTNGDKDACSYLYSKCARIAKEMGYRKIITYILESEPGTSLKASGFYLDQDEVGGGSWDGSQRGKSRTANEQMSMFPKKQKYPICKKQRWAKDL